jgi:hypothetical protein
MRSRVNRLLTRNDLQVYADQLEKELTAGMLTASQKETNWTNCMQLSLEEKRHAANHIRTQTDRQTVAWGFGELPAGVAGPALSPTTGAELPKAHRKTPQ